MSSFPISTIVLRTSQGETAEVSQHGGHVLSWRSASGEDRLFLSSKSFFEPPKAIRGGVPICFPQFGMMGPMSTQHGFARNMQFVVEQQDDSSTIMVTRVQDNSRGINSQTIVLKHDGQGEYSHPFELRSIVSLGNASFTQELLVKNTGQDPLIFTCALHTYYKVAAIDAVKVHGLKGTRYLNNLQNMQEGVEDNESMGFTSEFDRVYCNAPDLIRIEDVGSGHSFEISKTGFPDAVVWNPWVDKAHKMVDFGDEEYKEMLCIEPAVAGSGAVKIEPGTTWRGVQAIKYC